jgi:uncharacterized protein YlaI
MARAYQINDKKALLAFWCENCEQWVASYYTNDVSHVDNCSSWDFGGISYFERDEIADHTLYMCSECDEPVTLDSEPDMKQMGSWVCGECKARYEDQDDARECCL